MSRLPHPHREEPFPAALVGPSVVKCVTNRPGQAIVPQASQVRMHAAVQGDTLMDATAIAFEAPRQIPPFNRPT